MKRLSELLGLERFSIEEKVDADQVLLDLAAKFDSKEVYVKEPDDIDDEVKMVYTKEQLNKLRENAVVAIANDMGIDASVSDKKADTIEKILDAQTSVRAQ